MDSNEHLSESSSPEKPVRNNKVNLSLDTRYVIIALLVIIAVMLAIWRPWETKPTDQSRTITVSGESKVTAEPDEFVFSPSYQFKNANKDTALAELTKKSDEVIGKLKELGVPDNKIKTDSDGYNYNFYYDQRERLNNYTLRLTVTAGDREMSQKIQDYLLTTGPLDQVSPQANFSDAKRKELEGKARDEATKDARAKADQSAKNLGFKVGDVKTIEDGAGRARIGLFSADSASGVESSAKAAPGLAVQPGEDNLNYSVTVVYYVK